MSYKFTKDTSEYLSSLTPEMIKDAFEEYGFTMDCKEECQNTSLVVKEDLE